ncbi:UNVERIFIED_CONTAM: ToMV resistance protein Tm-2(2) [Sesamum latifolium]|uniref:ToMV resistance protein Tm-2(2) n=1 Tax=Sesamum latifolium TaxID=2727402 RepID=A0AAW2XDE2_9LAMI
MAEAAITAVINKTVEIAKNLVIETGSRLYHLQENVSWIERQMRTLQSFLKDAESKKASSHEVANLIITIRDLAQDVEDILDTYLPEIEPTTLRADSSVSSALLLLYVMASKPIISPWKSRKLRKEQQRLKFPGRLFLRAPHESKIFGRERILKKLEAETLREDEGSVIISVVRPAGVGKTTVAKRVYRQVKNEFEVSAIVYVSQEPRLGELLLDIAKQVGLNEDKMKENLEYNLYLLLQDKSYVILLDDVWDAKTWDSLRYILPSNSENGSRIIVTSRYVDVGRYINGEGSLIQLSLLDKNEGKELFFDLILPTSEEALQLALKDIGEKIVERCGGLPLAIVVAVGLFQARERSKHAWDQVLQSMSKGAENDCSKILALSYQDLQTELKPLFLYFGIFPEDREILVSELMQTWVAEKFIRVDGFIQAESIVEANIEKLISRNLIQVSRTRWDGRIRSVRIHDLLHSLCIQVAEDNNFFCTLSNLGIGISWFCFNCNKELFKFMKRNTSDLTFLRILIIENEGEGIHLPGGITKLSSLSYLRLKGTFRAIPSGIGSLKRLVTLEITVSVKFGALVPASILQMKYLKHLVLSSVRISPLRVYLKRRSCPTNRVKVALQNLETLDFNNGDGYITPGSFKKLSNLRMLRVFGADRQTFEILSDTTPLLQKLENLRVKLYFGRGDMSRLDLSRYQYVVKLHIFLDTNIAVTRTIVFPPNLV